MTTDDTQSSQISMVRASAAAVAPRDGNLARIRALRFQTPGFDMGVWREIAELGWIGMALSEEQGGVGFGMGEAAGPRAHTRTADRGIILRQPSGRCW